jgi:hypothetical protein
MGFIVQLHYARRAESPNVLNRLEGLKQVKEVGGRVDGRAFVWPRDSAHHNKQPRTDRHRHPRQWFSWGAGKTHEEIDHSSMYHGARGASTPGSPGAR